MAKFNEEEWRKDFINDRDDATRGIWMRHSQDARKFMSNNFEPLESDGLVDSRDPDNPVLKISSIPEKIRFLKGRIFYNPIEPAIAPYENESLDEESRMIAKAQFRYEMVDERGPTAINLMEEVDDVVNNALIDGLGVSDHRPDEKLRDELFYLGKPVHRCWDPHDVVFDRRAKKNKRIQRIHLISRWSEEEFKARWPRADLQSADAELRDIDPVTQQDIFYSIETQKRIEKTITQRVLTREQQEELKLPYRLVDDKELRGYIETLKETNPERFGSLSGEYVDDLRKVETTDWYVTSRIWAPGQGRPLSKEVDIGRNFSTEVLGFFPIIGSTLYNGVPFFLRDTQAMEIIGNTILTRLIMRADNPGGLYDLQALTPEEVKNHLETNKIGEWTGLKVWEGRIEDKIKPREVSPYLQYIQLYLEHVKTLQNNAFGTWKEQTGQAAFAGQSGRLGQLLIQSGAYMFFHFVSEIDKYLKRVFRRVLDLSVAMTPPSTLAVIAGEEFPRRLKIIGDGTYAKRIKRVNVEVKLDTMSEGERGFVKQMIAQLMMKGAFPPESGFREIGMKEPKRLAREMKEWMAQQSKAQAYAQLEKEHPELGRAIGTLVNEYMTQLQPLEGNTS
jgi:hypothetical protein